MSKETARAEQLERLLKRVYREVDERYRDTAAREQLKSFYAANLNSMDYNQLCTVEELIRISLSNTKTRIFAYS